MGGEEWINVVANNNNIPALCIGDSGLGEERGTRSKAENGSPGNGGLDPRQDIFCSFSTPHFPSLPTDSPGHSCGLWQKLFPQIPFPLRLGVQLC